MYEYACHEGDYAIPNILSADRARERMQAGNDWLTPLRSVPDA